MDDGEKTERPHLRIVDEGETLSFRERDALLPDLAVFDLDFARALRKNRFATVVDARIPEGTSVHDSVKKLVLEKLHGRIPSIRETEGFLRVSFAIENHSDSVARTVNEFAQKVGELIGSDLVDYQFFMIPESAKTDE